MADFKLCSVNRLTGFFLDKSTAEFFPCTTRAIAQLLQSTETPTSEYWQMFNFVSRCNCGSDVKLRPLLSWVNSGSVTIVSETAECRCVATQMRWTGTKMKEYVYCPNKWSSQGNEGTVNGDKENNLIKNLSYLTTQGLLKKTHEGYLFLAECLRQAARWYKANPRAAYLAPCPCTWKPNQSTIPCIVLPKQSTSSTVCSFKPEQEATAKCTWLL